jgi:hypothetical protein
VAAVFETVRNHAPELACRSLIAIGEQLLAAFLPQLLGILVTRFIFHSFYKSSINRGIIVEMISEMQTEVFYG